jgi:hypothetical protein
MSKLQVIRLCRRCFILVVSVSIMVIAASLVVSGQELPPRPKTTFPGTPESPPRPITATASIPQNLSFGAFYHGNTGGSVIIFPNGSRSSTGDVVLLTMGYFFSPGLYEVVANPGTIISILNGPDAILTGSNGGLLRLKIGDSYPPSPFVMSTMPPNATQLMIGGTLIVENPLSNPPGNYSGTFDITFVQE